MTAILSTTTQSMMVFTAMLDTTERSIRGPDGVSVHIFPEEIDTTQADVSRVDGFLRVQVPKKKHRNGT